MPNIEVVENPRRRRKTTRRRRKTTKKRRTTRRRRNPVASISNPRRRRGYTKKRRTYRRRRRNPSFGLGRLININAAIPVTAGFMIARISPGLISKFWPGAPAVGPLSYLVRIGGTLAAAYGVKMVTKKNDYAIGIATGGLAYVLYDLADQYLLPKIGLAGIGYESPLMSLTEIENFRPAGALKGYEEDYGLRGYEAIPMLDPALAA